MLQKCVDVSQTYAIVAKTKQKRQSTFL